MSEKSPYREVGVKPCVYTKRAKTARLSLPSSKECKRLQRRGRMVCKSCFGGIVCPDCDGTGITVACPVTRRPQP